MADSGPPPAPIQDPDRPVPQGPLDIAAMIAAIPTQSPSINVLIGALGRAMALAPRPKMTKTAVVETPGRTYSYKYATLADCMLSLNGPLDPNAQPTIKDGMVIPPPSAFNSCGLTLIHQPMVMGRAMYLQTRICHTSGEFIGCMYPVVPDVHVKPQIIGSAMTYARRYSLMALTGLVAEEDDDGQAAQAGADQRGERRAEPKGEPEPKAEPKGVRKSTKAAAEEPFAIETVQQALIKDGVVPSDEDLRKVIKWYETEMAKFKELPALAEFWTANVGFARALYTANKEVGQWIKDKHDARTKELAPKSEKEAA